jgi:GTP-binding protein LepA
MPLAEVITDFFDQLKSRTKGYASMSFHDIGYRSNKLVRLDIRIHGEEAPPLATIVHRDRAHERGKVVCEKLKELIPRQQFRVSAEQQIYRRRPLFSTSFPCCLWRRYPYKRALATNPSPRRTSPRS